MQCFVLSKKATHKESTEIFSQCECSLHICVRPECWEQHVSTAVRPVGQNDNVVFAIPRAPSVTCALDEIRLLSENPRDFNLFQEEPEKQATSPS